MKSTTCMALVLTLVAGMLVSCAAAPSSRGGSDAGACTRGRRLPDGPINVGIDGGYVRD
jgi:hypothetical protein